MMKNFFQPKINVIKQKYLVQKNLYSQTKLLFKNTRVSPIPA